MEQTFDSKRFTNCTLFISSEKKATGTRLSMAIFLARLRANEVLPIAGRPAMMTRSDGCQPAVILSNCVKPVEMPVKPPLSWLWAAFTNSSCACFTMGSICVYSCAIFFCESSNRLPSARCINSSTSMVSSNASVSIIEANCISWRAKYFCANMRP